MKQKWNRDEEIIEVQMKMIIEIMDGEVAVRSIRRGSKDGFILKIGNVTRQARHIAKMALGEGKICSTKKKHKYFLYFFLFLYIWILEHWLETYKHRSYYAIKTYTTMEDSGLRRQEELLLHRFNKKQEAKGTT